MRERRGTWIGIVGLLAAVTWATSAQAVPRFVGSTRMFEVSQPGRFTRQAPAVERVETAASFYDFYSASSHTGFEYTRRSLVFLYRDLRDEGNLSIFFLHGVDYTGQAAHLRQPYGRVEGCIRGIPGGARIAVSDDNTREFDWSSNCNGRPTNNGNIARGYWSFGDNTDGGAVDRIRTDVDWEITVDIRLFHAMDEWRYFMADGDDIILDTNLPLIIRSRANNAGDLARSPEGDSMTICALAIDNDRPAHLTYTFNWNDGSPPEEVRRPPAELACMQHVFPDSGNYQVDIAVRDPQGRGDSKVFTAIMDAAPPRLYPPENPTGTSEIPMRLVVRADDGAADVHQSRWDFNGDGNWDTPWINGVETQHTFANAGRQRIRVVVRDDEGMSATTEYDVNIAQRVPRCGDGVLDANRGEACDDGNDEQRDTCQSNCTVTPPNPRLQTGAVCPVVNGTHQCANQSSALGNDGPGPVRIDMSASIDPDSRNPLRFRYESVGNQGGFVQSADFQDVANDMGPVVDYVPSGDGARVDQIRVIGTDVDGNETVAIVPITIPNTPPSFENLNYTQRLAPPVILEPQGNDEWPIEVVGPGRYRLTLPLDPTRYVSVRGEYRISERFNEPLTLSMDYTGDGRADNAYFPGADDVGVSGRVVPANGAATGVASFLFNLAEIPDNVDSVERRVVLNATDGDPNGAISASQMVRIVKSVDEADQYRFNIDVGADDSFETVNSLDPVVSFSLPGGRESVRIRGHLLSARGEVVPFDLGDVVLPNHPPRFIGARLVRQDGFDVVIAAGAIDIDGEPLTVTVDWGDGTVSTGRHVIYRHSYANARFQAYTIRLRVTDSRGLSDTHEIGIDIVRPALQEADVSSLTWVRMTETEGAYDGIRGFAIDPEGTLFTHNYMDSIRRSSDGGNTWVEVLSDVECCGSIATRDAGEIFVASPSGLYFSGDNGDNWALFDESKFDAVAVSPDQQYVVATTSGGVRRYDLTARLVDTWPIVGRATDIESCATGNRSALATRVGQVYINDRRDMAPSGWRIPEDRFGKGKGNTSVSFDKACNLYNGLWNGYRVFTHTNSVIPAAMRAPKHLFHVLGSSSRNVYGGAGNVTDILAWPDGAAIVGTDRGLWAENIPWNAYRKPYWTSRQQGIDRSSVVRHLKLHPTSGHVYLATSSAVQMPKYCRKARRGSRRGRRGRRGRVSFYYVFCGFTAKFYGGVYRSENPLLLSRTVGEGGVAFDARQARGTRYDGLAGGLVVHHDDNQPTFMWLVNTADSTVSRWDPGVTPPRVGGTYRVGLPTGECPGQCCWANGCNMPSRVVVDTEGDAYIASRGFGMQGTVTKVAGSLDRCLDRNDNGRIDTARGTVPLDYGTDECVLWTVPVGPEDTLLRGLAVDLGDSLFPNGYPWVGGYNSRTAWKLNPDTGAVMETVNLGLSPHGMVVASDGMMYIGTLGEGRLQSVNTITGEAGPIIANPAALRNGENSSYGLAVDGYGRIWMGGWTSQDAIAFDPSDNSWCRISLPFDMNVGRGITMDAEGRMWAAVGGDEQSHVAYWHVDDCRGGQSVALPQDQLIALPDGLRGPTGVGSDGDGNIWVLHYLSRAIAKIDPRDNMRVETFEGTNQVYSFSDFSGMMRRLSAGQGSYYHDIQAECDTPQWTALDWQASTPPNGSITFTVQTSARRDKLAESPIVRLAQVPGEDGPINVSGRLAAAGVQSRQFVRIGASLKTGENGTSPVLSTFTVRWNCE